MPESFAPPKRILMGPGPSDVHPRVLQALSRPTIGHLDPEFVQLMDEIKTLLHQAFKTTYPLTIPISGPGTAGMECCVANLLEPRETAVVCVNGVFGGRIAQMVERCGARAVRVEDDWGQAVSLDKVERILKAHPEAKLLAFVHAETSTGALSDAKALAELARQHDCLTLVDTVTSLGGSPLEVEAWGLDAVYAGTQKCLSAPPGLSPITLSPKAMEAIQARQTPVQSWFLDLNLVMGYWGEHQKRAYHHTAPVNALYGLHEALLILQEEGLEASWQRHQQNHEELKAGLLELGLDFVVAEQARLPQLNTVWVPEGVDEATLRQRLLHDFHLEIGAGLGDLAGRVWRIGLMGYSSRRENIDLCLKALKEVLS